MWDLDQPGLGLRSTPTGKPSFVFQGWYAGKTTRITIGRPDNWTILEARARARKIQREIDEDLDPRRVNADAIAADVTPREMLKRDGVLVEEAWFRYVAERREPRSKHHYDNHRKMVRLPGQRVRGRPTMKHSRGFRSS